MPRVRGVFHQMLRMVMVPRVSGDEVMARVLGVFHQKLRMVMVPGVSGEAVMMRVSVTSIRCSLVG